MIKEWLEYEEKNKGLSPETIRGYENDLRNFARWLNARGQIKAWREVRRRTIEEYLRSMHDAGQKPATIRRALSSIRCFFNYCMKQELTEINPARYCEMPKRPKTLPATIDEKAIESYVDDVTKPLALRAMIATIYETGMRISEVMAMETRDINYQQHSIRVYGKGLKHRNVYFGYRTERLIKAYLGGRTGLIFNGEQRTARYYIWKALREHSTNGTAGPHMIRHTYATKMINQGMPISCLQKILGHENPNTTQIYAETADKTAREAYLRATA